MPPKELEDLGFLENAQIHPVLSSNHQTGKINRCFVVKNWCERKELSLFRSESKLIKPCSFARATEVLKDISFKSTNGGQDACTKCSTSGLTLTLLVTMKQKTPQCPAVGDCFHDPVSTLSSTVKFWRRMQRSSCWCERIRIYLTVAKYSRQILRSNLHIKLHIYVCNL